MTFYYKSLTKFLTLNLYLICFRSDNLQKLLLNFQYIYQGEHNIIYNWSLQPFSQDYWPRGVWPQMLCAFILYVSGGIYSLNSTLYQIFWETFHGNFIYSEFLPETAEKITEEKFFVYCFNVGPGARTLFTSNKPTHYLLDLRLDICSVFVL